MAPHAEARPARSNSCPATTCSPKFDFARRAGFDGIELRAKGDGHFAGRLPELRAAARAGVVMRTVCPDTDHFIGDFDADLRRDAIAQLRTQLSVIAELGGEGVLTPASWGMFSLRLPPFTPPRTAEDDRKVLLDALVAARRARGSARASGSRWRRSTATRTTCSTGSTRSPTWPTRSGG